MWPTQQQAGQQYVQGQQPQGQWPSGQQTMGQQPSYEYGIDHLPQSPQAPQQQQQRPQQQPQGQPPVSGYWPQPQQPQAPQQPPQQQWPAQTQQQPQGPQRVNLDPNTILDGPNVPNELRGRTWGEAQRLYSALATNWLQQAPRPQQAPQQQAAPQQQTPAERWAATQQGNAGAQSPQQPGQFWQNPEQRVAEIVGQVIDQRVMPALQPVVQQTHSQAVAQARNIAMQAVPDFQHLEADVVQILATQGNPAALTDPQVWAAATDMARGRRMAAGQYNPQPRQQDPRQPHQFQGNGQQPGQQRPPAYSFFTEQPTAPSMGQAYGPTAQPTPQEAEAAQKWGMPVEQFMQWKYGNQAMPAVPAGGY